MHSCLAAFARQIWNVFLILFGVDLVMLNTVNELLEPCWYGFQIIRGCIFYDC